MTTVVKASVHLRRLFNEWRRDQARLNMALQTLQGAQTASLKSEIAFKAAASLAHGKDATFAYDEKKGLTFSVPSAVTRAQVKRRIRAAIRKGRK